MNEIEPVLREIVKDEIGRHEYNYLHTLHRHAEPVLEPKPKKEKPRTTVLTFGKEGKQGEYSFKGKPDILRIGQEVIGDGKMAAIVIPYRNEVEGLLIHSHEIFPIPSGYLKQGWVGYNLSGTPFHGWYIMGYKIGVWITRIQQAISEWQEKQPKPKWEPKSGMRVQCEDLGISKNAVLLDYKPWEKVRMWKRANPGIMIRRACSQCGGNCAQYSFLSSPTRSNP
jgi:hypothetical protein